MNPSLELTFDWSSPSGELPEDSMGRAVHAKNLTRFLIHKGQETSYVLNINAKWGTGKSYFLRRWLSEIEHAYPAVYIDAWSSDHSSDPLLSVVSAIKNKMQELHGISRLETELFEGVAKAVKAAAPAVIKSLIRGQLKKWTGLTSEEFSNFISEDDLADTGAKLVEQAINAHNEAAAGVKAIKDSIQDWLESVVRRGERQYPLFIFIDELDRCRPTYAIEMLETIKHIFDMKNVVFVVATDKDQLQHSIKAIYGAGFDSRLYLDRFFTRTVTLNNPSRSDFIARKVNASETFTKFKQDDKNFVFLASEEERQQDMQILLTGIADGLSWPLRTVNLWLDRLEAALIISSRRLDIILLSFMMALETDDADWLRQYQENVHIFRTGSSDGVGKVNFKTFLITTRWSFSQFKQVLAESGFDHDSHQMNTVHVPQISLLDFVLNRLSWLNTGNTNSIVGIINGYRGLLHQGEITGQVYGSGKSQSNYHNVAMDIHSVFHHQNGTTFDHYIEICRYSSLMS